MSLTASLLSQRFSQDRVMWATLTLSLENTENPMTHRGEWPLDTEPWNYRGVVSHRYEVGAPGLGWLS